MGIVFRDRIAVTFLRRAWFVICVVAWAFAFAYLILAACAFGFVLRVIWEAYQ